MSVYLLLTVFRLTIAVIVAIRACHGPFIDNLVNKTKILGFSSSIKTVPLESIGDIVQFLTRMRCINFVQSFSDLQNFFGMNLNIGGLSLEPAGRLMDHNSRIG